MQKPTPVYAIKASGHISHETPCRMQDNHISTGIYRCLILDFDLKFCENSWTSRISADKRFLILCQSHPTSLHPRPGVGSVNLTLLAWSARRSAAVKLQIIFEVSHF